jgi:lysophospholipase L1-like esterase
MNRPYLFNILKNIPAFPIMYWQSQRIRRTIPDLPEAIEPKGAFSVPNSKPFTLVTLGESTVAGVGVERHADGFTGTLASELSQRLDRTVNWCVYAKSGFTAKKVHRLILPQIEESHVDLFVIGLGGNDSFEFTTPYWWEHNILKLITELRTRFGPVPIAFANMPPVREFPAFSSLMHSAIGNQVDFLNTTLLNTIRELENVYFDSSQLDFRGWIAENNLDLVPDDFFSDGVHPSVLTYQTWAKHFTEFVLKEAHID